MYPLILLFAISLATPSDLKCDHCRESIEDRYYNVNGNVYHQNCYRDEVALKCAVCSDIISGQYSIDPWGNSFHTEHLTSTGLCESCSKIILDRREGGGYLHSHDRFVCGSCSRNSVDTVEEVQASLKRVLEKLHSVGFYGFPESIPITIVSKSELLKLNGGNEHTKGLTDYKVHFSQGARGKIQKHSKVYNIYILDNLTELVFDAVLAHELLHVWLFENDLDYNAFLTEGFCNLGAMLIYDRSSTELAKVQLDVMNKNTDTNYGEGYRSVRKCLEKSGWFRLIGDFKNGRARRCY